MGSYLRPYVVTAGRTRHGIDVADDARVKTVGPAWEVGRVVPPEAFRIAELCATPHSLREIAEVLSIPLGVARVLIADLLETKAVAFLR
jgi:hypothetical protein